MTWILANSHLNFVSLTIRQYSRRLRRLIVKCTCSSVALCCREDIIKGVFKTRNDKMVNWRNNELAEWLKLFINNICLIFFYWVFSLQFSWWSCVLTRNSSLFWSHKMCRVCWLDCCQADLARHAINSSYVGKLTEVSAETLCWYSVLQSLCEDGEVKSPQSKKRMLAALKINRVYNFGRVCPNNYFIINRALHAQFIWFASWKLCLLYL